MTYQLDDGSVQEELDFNVVELPAPKLVMPEDAELTVSSSNIFYRAVMLFPNFFGEDIYSTALNWWTLTNGEKAEVLRKANQLNAKRTDTNA